MNYLHPEFEPSLPTLLSRLIVEPALAAPALCDAGRAALLDEARTRAFRKARATIGDGDRRVRQRMDVMDDFSDHSRFRRLTAQFQSVWDRIAASAIGRYFDEHPTFNDLMLQRYDVGAIGITPHRDRTGYRLVVCLFVLAGRGKFHVCADRSGRDAREIAHQPGDVVLMRGPGFLGAGERPFHYVSDISHIRYVFGLRHDRDKQGRTGV